MTVIGTAGHVDHGKSTLLEALTGRDPDRWEEEKRRGLTIDLGFVWTTLPSGREVSFVDVPGHERFIKNMLAGIEAIDVALLVVAADEGWMPQSEEHLAVLDLLDVNKAVVALTKIDRVDDDLVELATLEVIERLEGTGLASSPIVAVSATAGAGLEAVASALDDALPVLSSGDDPRLWVDRRFTVSGAGTVVTGTLLGGPVGVGDTLVVQPGDVEVRVRGIQSHEQTVERAEPHRRVAVNLVGAPDELGRGDMLGQEGTWLTTDRFTAKVRAARYVDEIGERGAYHIHVGSAAVPARLRPVGEGMLVTIDRPLPLRYGDRFIIRETGRRAVVGGGTVLDPAPPRRGTALNKAAALQDGLPAADAAAALLAIRGTEIAARLRAHSGGLPEGVTPIGDMLVTEDDLALLTERAIAEVESFHEATPLRPGLPLATLASQLRVPLEMAQYVVDEAAELDSDGAVVWKAGRSVSLDPSQQEAWEDTKRILTKAGLQAPRASELPIDQEVRHSLIRAGELVRISEDLVYLPGEADRLRTAIAAMVAEFTVADFRDELQLSRKYAVPILEWADAEGLTRRRGDVRTATGAG